MLTASGKVTLELQREKVRKILLIIRQHQQELQKITAEYPPKIFTMSRQLDVTLEQIKMKVANQLD